MNPRSTPKAPPLKNDAASPIRATGQPSKSNRSMRFRAGTSLKPRSGHSLAIRHEFGALSREDDASPRAISRSLHHQPDRGPQAIANQNPEWNADHVEHVFVRALADLITYDPVARLSRCKDKHP